MNKRIVLLALLFWISLPLFSQNVRIDGLTNRPGALVRLFIIDDLLTRDAQKKAETRADANGLFRLETSIDGINEAQIAIDLERVDLILCPDATYEVEVNLPEQEKNTSYFERVQPELIIKKSTDDNLHEQIFIADNIINDFMIDNFNLLVRRHQLSLLDSLDSYIEEALPGLEPEYVKDHIRYRKAALLLAVTADGGRRVVDEYYDKNKVLYSQSAYFDLFVELFQNYFHSRQFNITDFRRNFYGGYNDFMNYMKTDSLVKNNPALGELIVIWNLRQHYYEWIDSKDITMTYLQQIQKNTQFQQNKKIVSNVIKEINNLSVNSPAPQFSLKNSQGKEVKLSSFSNEVVVVQFVGEFSPLIINDFYNLKEFVTQWGNKVKMLTVALSTDYQLYDDLFKKEAFSWELLNLGDNILLLEEYAVPTFPAYIIIKPGTKIGMSPAPAPDQGLDKHVARFLKK